MDFVKRMIGLTTSTADRCDAAGARIVTAWERMATDAEAAADRHHAALNGTNGRPALPEAETTGTLPTTKGAWKPEVGEKKGKGK